MAEQSTIEWTRSTFNPWWGCTKVSPGCDNCYAERDAHRFGTEWGPDADRRFFGDKHWDEPLKWNKKAAEEQAVNPNVQWRVFCASMADVFDNDVPQAVRERLWDLIDATPNLTWLLLTKRIGNVGRMIPDRWSVSLPRNVWLGISVVNQEEADRDIPKLLQIKAYIHWLSMEPLLGAVDARKYLPIAGMNDMLKTMPQAAFPLPDNLKPKRAVSWIVCGGESGKNARPMHPAWAKSLRDQCKAAGVAYLFKQWGEWVPRSSCHHTFEDGKSLSDIDPASERWPCVRLTEDGNNGSWLENSGQGDHAYMQKVGKKMAGRLLDGVLHDEYPQVT